jgi:predicted RecB family endonuclease
MLKMYKQIVGIMGAFWSVAAAVIGRLSPIIILRNVVDSSNTLAVGVGSKLLHSRQVMFRSILGDVVIITVAVLYALLEIQVSSWHSYPKA